MCQRGIEAFAVAVAAIGANGAVGAIGCDWCDRLRSSDGHGGVIGGLYGCGCRHSVAHPQAPVGVRLHLLGHFWQFDPDTGSRATAPGYCRILPGECRESAGKVPG